MVKIKILPAHHTGRLQPHHHTSYGSLLLIVALAAAVVLSVQQVVAADTSGSGSTGVYAVVPAPLITTPAIIQSPANGQVFATVDPVTIRGACPGGSLVKIYKNEVMAGAMLCGNGSFSLPISLFMGANSLIVRAYNANDIPGPDSSPITVQFLPPGASATAPFDSTQPPAGQFYITTDVYYRGGMPGDTMSWTINLAGGQSPYALNVSWGDGKSDLISRPAAGPIVISHVYSQPANTADSTYPVKIKASDQKGATAFLQVFALVPGGHRVSSITTTTSQGISIGSILQIAWRTLAILVVSIASFWLGEKRIIFILHHHLIR